MFPSSGYFRALPCPYFPHEECHRPHCQFKHNKPKMLSRTTNNVRDKLPPFLQRSSEAKLSPSSSSADTLPDIFDHSETDTLTTSLTALDSSADAPVTSSSPPAPNYSPLPESPPNLENTELIQGDSITPELGEACEETFIFTSDPSTNDSKSPSDSVELEPSSELPVDTESSGPNNIHSDSEVSFTPTTTDEEGTLFLQPDIIAKLQAPLAPLKRRAESSTSETSHSDLSPVIKRKRILLTAEKRPNVLVISKKIPKLTSNSVLIDRDAIYMPKSSSVGSNVLFSAQETTKPSLPLTMDSKVPVKMRQKFLDKVFSEYVRVLPENDAHSKVIYPNLIWSIFVSLLDTNNLITFIHSDTTDTGTVFDQNQYRILDQNEM